MQTSSFFKSFDRSKGISIARYQPQGMTFPTAPELAPTYPMIKSGYSYEEYVEMLKKRGVTPKAIFTKYGEKILLCWERDPEKCHRGYVARWIKESLGVDVPEVLEAEQPVAASEDGDDEKTGTKVVAQKGRGRGKHPQLELF